MNKPTSFRGEFHWKNFGFNLLNTTESKHSFVRSKIQFISPLTILIYRIIVCAYLTLMIILSVISKQNPGKWLIYMTSVNYTMVYIYFLTALAVSCYAYFFNLSYSRGTIIRKQNWEQPEVNENQHGSVSSAGLFHQARYANSVDSIILGIEENCTNRSSVVFQDVISLESNTPPRPVSLRSDTFLDSRNELSCINQINWLLFTIAFNLSFIVVIVYWGILLPSEQPTTIARWYMRIDRHLIMLLLTIIDHMITSIPVKILHFIYPSTIFFLYGVFNIVYTSLSKTLIYSIIDFDKSPYRAVGMILGTCIVVIPAIQLILYCVYKLKGKFVSTT